MLKHLSVFTALILWNQTVFASSSASDSVEELAEKMDRLSPGFDYDMFEELKKSGISPEISGQLVLEKMKVKGKIVDSLIDSKTQKNNQKEKTARKKIDEKISQNQRAAAGYTAVSNSISSISANTDLLIKGANLALPLIRETLGMPLPNSKGALIHPERNNKNPWVQKGKNRNNLNHSISHLIKHYSSSESNEEDSGDR